MQKVQKCKFSRGLRQAASSVWYLRRRLVEFACCGAAAVQHTLVLTGVASRLRQYLVLSAAKFTVSVQGRRLGCGGSHQDINEEKKRSMQCLSSGCSGSIIMLAAPRLQRCTRQLTALCNCYDQVGVGVCRACLNVHECIG